jgi:hypothetical protein
LREVLRLSEKIKAAGWERFKHQSALGASLAGQKKYSDAEPLLLSGYEGMVQWHSAILAADRPALLAAGERIVRLYTDWGKPKKAAEWVGKLQDTNRFVTPKNP